jgi:hypothetical protein
VPDAYTGTTRSSPETKKDTSRDGNSATNSLEKAILQRCEPCILSAAEVRRRGSDRDAEHESGFGFVKLPSEIRVRNSESKGVPPLIATWS